MLEKYNKFLAEAGPKHWIFAARRDKEFMDEVYAKTSDMEGEPDGARIYFAVHNEPRICQNGNKRKFKSISAGIGFCGPAGKCPCAAKAVSDSLLETLSQKTDEDWKSRTEKTTITVQEKYGVSNVGQLEKTKEAHKAFYADTEKVSEAIAKNEETMLKKYGVRNALQLGFDRREPRQRHMEDETKRILNDKESFNEFISDKSIPRAAELLKITTGTIRNFIEAYNIKVDLNNSSYENEIQQFLTKNQIGFVQRTRKIIPPLELDFYIPSIKLGIEFNGLYFHSSAVIPDDKHKTKWVLAQNAGVKLLMINEDEWLYNADAIKSKILYCCGLSIRGVGARKLYIKEIDYNIAMDFCADNHIQGSPSTCMKAFGAFHGEKLVSVLTISKQRGIDSFEITRFCTDGKTYAGVFSRLLKEALKQYPRLVTFADLRYSDGGLYETTGFTRVSVLKPDYKYVYRNKSYHKSLYTKARIAEKFGIDMTNKTEREAMIEQGFHRIYDCGKIKYVIEC